MTGVDEYRREARFVGITSLVASIHQRLCQIEDDGK